MSILERVAKSASTFLGGTKKGGGLGGVLSTVGQIAETAAVVKRAFHPDQVPGIDPFGLLPGGRPPGLPSLPSLGGGGGGGMGGIPTAFLPPNTMGLAGASKKKKIAVLNAGVCCPPGYHPAKDGSGRCVRNRRMNVCNMRAARRAVRRLRGARKALQSIEKLLPRRPAPRARGSGKRHLTGPVHT